VTRHNSNSRKRKAPARTGASRKVSCHVVNKRTHLRALNERTSARNKISDEFRARHYCRNLKCRSRLPAPIENVRKAFCCRGCHNAFYRTRCLVCEKDTGTNPLTGEKRKRLGQRKFCGRKCKAEARQFPHVYAGVLPGPVRRTRSSSSCDKMDLKTGPAGDRPTSHCLRGLWWGGDSDRDHSLYDRDGLTIARVVPEGDGRYHLRTPVAIPRQAWAHLEEAKRGAESFALIAGFLRRRLAP